MPKHGGNIYQNPECSAEWLDFSANINPFGVPETVQHAIQRAVAALVHYPDPAQQKLRQALAEFHGRLPAEIVCGNGGADVIFRIAHALKPQHALLPVPAFSEYEAALREAGCHVKHWNMPFPYQITPVLLDELRQGNYDFLVLCNPNNPTGTGIPPALLEQLLYLAAEKHIFVLLDECFCDMAETEPDIVSMIPRLSEFPHVLVLKSLTKLYALAGLRLGYGICSDQEVTAKIAHTGQPWSVNLLAEAAGIAALSAEDYRKMSLEFLQNERWRLFDELGKLGFRMWKPSANYVFFQAEQCPDLDRQLLPYGILLRHCDTYDGLDATYCCAAAGGKSISAALSAVHSGRGGLVMAAKSLMVLGTMSSAGKSFVTAGLCRIFRQDGYRTAPFKSQNMALNSYITADGMEMGRAQVMQAEAAGIAPDVRMNPILLKPTSDSGSQVIVNGEIYGTMRAQEYYTKKQELIPHILKAYHALAAENDIIVLEGAGSPAEINLKSVDIVNLGMAELSDSPAILVGDIDRGGVFASLYGTIMLLDDAERRRIQGIVINKFRGDVEILKSGLTMLEELTGIPVLGVVPYLPLELDDEDSLSERLSRREAAAESLLDVAVIRFPRISNFTDFEALEQVEGVSVRYVSRRGELGTPDMIFLAGTKSTMADLRWLRQSGLEAELLKCHEKGVFLMGICGGFQMLGKRLCDPEQVEDGGELRGMGLLDVETVFRPEKHRAQTAGTVARLSGQLEPLSGCAVQGYEIHMGETVYTETAQPFAVLTDGRKDGCVCADGTVCGTYLHGIFDTPELTQKLVQLLLEKKGISGTTVPAVDFAAKKEQEYDKLADLLREHLDMPKIYDILNSWGKTP